MEKATIKSVSELGCKDMVLFPRTQLKGIQFTEVAKDEFSAECKIVEGHGEFWIITQAAYPRMVFQVFLARDLAHFDQMLGQLLGMHEPPVYIDGCNDFMVLFQGNNDYVQITQANHREVYNQIKAVEQKAACWWYEYGKEAISIK